MAKFKFFIALILIGSSILLTSCGKQGAGTQNESEYLTKAQNLLDSANNTKDDNLRNEALKLYQEFPSLFPNSTNVGASYQKVAEIYMVQNKFEDCVKTLTMVTDKFKGKADGIKAQFQIGYIYFDNIKNLDKAKEAFQKLVTDYPASNTPDAGLTASADQMIKDIDIMKSGKTYDDIIQERIMNSEKNTKNESTDKPKDDGKDKNDTKQKDDKLPPKTKEKTQVAPPVNEKPDKK